MVCVKISSEWSSFIKGLNEVQRRRAAGLKALELGYGGISELQRVSGLARDTIRKGIREAKQRKIVNIDRLRKKGAGRKRIQDQNPKLKKRF